VQPAVPGSAAGRLLLLQLLLWLLWLLLDLLRLVLLLQVAGEHAPAVLLPNLVLLRAWRKPVPLVWVLRLLLVQLLGQFVIQLVINAVPAAAKRHEGHHSRHAIQLLVPTS
jgi:hypothetical protein